MFCNNYEHTLLILSLCLSLQAMDNLRTEEEEDDIGPTRCRTVSKKKCGATLKSDEISYLNSENWTHFEDVVILSENGRRFGFNRCLLASMSSLCKKIFLQLYECPLANLDEVICISSDFSEMELVYLRKLFYGGLDGVSDHRLFMAIGLDLGDVPGSINKSISEKAVCPMQVAKNGLVKPDLLPDKVEVKVEDCEDYEPDHDFESFPEPMSDVNYKAEDDFLEDAPLKRRKAKRSKPKGPKLKEKKEKKEKKELPFFGNANDPDEPVGTKAYFYFPDLKTVPRDMSKFFQCEKCSRQVFLCPLVYKNNS